MEYLPLVEKLIYVMIGVILGTSIMSIIFMGRGDDE